MSNLLNNGIIDKKISKKNGYNLILKNKLYHFICY